MVYQGCDVLWKHLWGADLDYMWHLPLRHVLDGMWVLQPTVALLGRGSLCSAYPAGTLYLLATLQDSAAQWKYPGSSLVVRIGHMANQHGGLYYNLRVVH